MQQMRDPSSEGPADKRVLRKAQSIRVPEPGEDTDLQVQMAALQTAMTERLEMGLRAIHRSAAKLMRQVATEVWRANAPGPDGAGQGVIDKLARDDALRGLLTHVDERYQGLHFELQKTTEALKRLAGATGQAFTKAEQSRETVERVAHAAQEQGRHIQHGFQELAARVQRALEPLTARLDALEALQKAAAANQRAELQEFSERIGNGLARVGNRLREGFTAMTERSAAESREAISRLEAAVQEEMERLRQQSHEQAARSLEGMHVVSRSVHEATEQYRGELDSMRGSIEARIDLVAHTSKTSMETAVEELRGRVEAMIENAVARVGARSAAVFETVARAAEAPSETGPHSTIDDPVVVQLPDDAQDVEIELPDLGSAIAGLGALDLEDET